MGCLDRWHCLGMCVQKVYWFCLFVVVVVFFFVVFLGGEYC